MIKQMAMRANQLLTNDSIISVDNNYSNGSFPYWISNPTGATLKRIKIMAGRVIAGKLGGTLTLEVYQTRDVAVRNVERDGTKFPNSGVPADTDEFYTSTYAITDINIPNDCYIIGLVKINGEIQVVNLFVYVDYEDNPIEE